MANFAGKFGLTVPRIRNRGGPSSLPSRDEDSLSNDVAPGNVAERVRRRDLFNTYGRRGATSILDKENKGGLGLKDIVKMQRNADKDKFDREKSFVNKWTELVLKAREMEDPVLQKHLINYGRDYIETLSPQTQALLEPILRSGPFSKSMQKLEMYDKLNPAPSVTADPEKEPLAHAQQVFAQEHWKDARTHFATGQVPPKRSLIPAQGKDGVYYMEDKDGRTSVVTEKDLQLNEFAKQYGVHPGEVISNNGVYGKEVTANIGGVMRKFRPFTSFPGGNTTLQLDSGITQQEMDKRYKSATELLATLAVGDDKLIKKNPLAALVNEQYKSNELFETSVGATLEQAYPGLTFIKPKEKATVISEFLDLIPGVGGGNYVKGNQIPFSGGYIEGDNSTIVMRPGARTIMALPNGQKAKVIYDESTDSVFDTSNGSHLGTWQEAQDGIARRNNMMQDFEAKKKKRDEEQSSFSDQFNIGSGT